MFHWTKEVNAAGIISAANTAVNMIIKTFGQDEGWERRGGGYFCLADGVTGFPLLIFPIGIMPEEKVVKYLAFCQEKAKRLAKHSDHMSSWESRNPDENQWGGAIKIEDLIYSFSGLPELGDEAAMLGCATAIRVQSGEPRGTKAPLKDLCAMIATRSNNPYWGSRLSPAL